MKKSELKQLIKEEITKVLSENERLPRTGTKVLDHMGDEYQIIKVEPKTITLKPLTFKGANSIFPQDLDKDATVEEFWSYFKRK